MAWHDVSSSLSALARKSSESSFNAEIIQENCVKSEEKRKTDHWSTDWPALLMFIYSFEFEFEFTFYAGKSQEEKLQFHFMCLFLLLLHRFLLFLPNANETRGKRVNLIVVCYYSTSQHDSMWSKRGWDIRKCVNKFSLTTHIWSANI